eukprot:6327119-Prymnesium_polylepis.3
MAEALPLAADHEADALRTGQESVSMDGVGHASASSTECLPRRTQTPLTWPSCGATCTRRHRIDHGRSECRWIPRTCPVPAASGPCHHPHDPTDRQTDAAPTACVACEAESYERANTAGQISHRSFRQSPRSDTAEASNGKRAEATCPQRLDAQGPAPTSTGVPARLEPAPDDNADPAAQPPRKETD